MDRKGSLLILSIWTLLVLALFASVVGSMVQQKLKMVQRIENRSKLRNIAEAGVRKALQVLALKELDSQLPDVLNDSWSLNENAFKDIVVGDGSFTISYEIGDTVYYGMIDEESKVNLHTITSARILANLFQLTAGLGQLEASKIAYALLDWVDEDDYPYEAGAEKKYYLKLQPPYQPKNEFLDVPQELLFIRGVTPAIYKQITPYLTLYGSGSLNLNTVPPIILFSIGIQESLVKKIMRYRAGEDGIERTPDDRYFISLGSVVDSLQATIALDEAEAASLNDYVQSGIFTLRSKVFSIHSQATLRYQTESLMVQCVAARTGEILYWHENFISLN